LSGYSGKGGNDDNISECWENAISHVVIVIAQKFVINLH